MWERGNVINFFFLFLLSSLWHAVSHIRATLPQRHLPISGGQGQAWKGANAWGCTSLFPQRGSQVGRAWTGGGASGGKYFLMYPCVLQRRGTTWPGSLEAQSFLGSSSEGASHLAVSCSSIIWVLHRWWADRQSGGTACAVGASPTRPSCEHQLCWLPLMFPFEKLNE